MTLDKLITDLKGKTVKSVQKAKNCDAGLNITFTDDSTLEFGYSGFEGFTAFNNEIITELL